jgi:YD repeat-containing protein
MTERDRWGLRGPVQSCQLQRTWYPGRCGADRCETAERGDTTLVEFRRDGSLVRRWHHNPDGTEWTSRYEYDGAGRLMRIRTEDMAGLVEVRHHEYDAMRRLVRLVVSASDGSDRLAESYEYDQQGRKKTTVYVDPAVQRPDTAYFWSVEGTDAIYSAPGAATVATLHDARGQPIELLFRDVAGQALSRVEFAYDEGGHLLEEAQTRMADVLPPETVSNMDPAQLEAIRTLFGVGGEPTRRRHRYDGRGHRIETSSSLFGPLGSDRKTMAYNDQGDLIRELSEDERREYDIDDEGRLSEKPDTEGTSRSEARFHYDYDGRGNWTMKRGEGRATSDQEFAVSSVERRTLVYYD